MHILLDRKDDTAEDLMLNVCYRLKPTNCTPFNWLRKRWKIICDQEQGFSSRDVALYGVGPRNYALVCTQCLSNRVIDLEDGGFGRISLPEPTGNWGRGGCVEKMKVLKVQMRNRK